MARPVYPSDRTGWCRIRSHRLFERTEELTDNQFRAMIMLIAYENENRIQSDRGRVVVSKKLLSTVAPNRRDSNATATRAVRELCTSLAWELHETDTTMTIQVEIPEQKQASTPKDSAPDSTETPDKEEGRKKNKNKNKKEIKPRPSGPSLFPRADDPQVDEIHAGLERWKADLSNKCPNRHFDSEAVMESVRDWSHGNGKRRPDWLASCRQAVRDGWCLKGHEQATKDRARRAGEQRLNDRQGHLTERHKPMTVPEAEAEIERLKAGGGKDPFTLTTIDQLVDYVGRLKRRA